MSKFDSFWRAVVGRPEFRRAVKAAANGSEARIPVSGLTDQGSRESESTKWRGTAYVRHPTLVRAGMSHAKSLGNMVLESGILAAWLATEFRFTIDASGDWLTVRRENTMSSTTTTTDKVTRRRPPWAVIIGSGVVLSITILGLVVLALRYPALGRVEGDGFLRQRGGGVVTCAGSEVWLLRLTEEERAGLLGSMILLGGDLRGRFRDKSDPFATAVCGVDGRFIFDNVPHGTYGVVTTVEWLAGDETQGGDVYAIFEISPEESIGRPRAIYSVE